MDQMHSTRSYRHTTEGVELPIESGFGVPALVDVPARDGNTTALESVGHPWCLTCVDDAGQERPDVTNDHRARMRAAVEGTDDVPMILVRARHGRLPDDEGSRGRELGALIAEDCAFLTVYIQPSAISDPADGGWGRWSRTEFRPKDSVWHPSSRIALRMVRRLMRLMDSLSSTGWRTTSASSQVMHGSMPIWVRVMLSEATPFVNRIGSAEPPIPVSDLAAFDHPDDRGTAIDVSWSPAVEDDFSHYIIWVSS